MIDFMVLGLPRSGTAWLANLLTTDTSLCLHESFMHHDLKQLDSKENPPAHKFGISETSAIFIPDEINQHSAFKIIIERPIDEINLSLYRLGLPCIDDSFVKLLKNIEGYRISFNDLFEASKIAEAYKLALNKELNHERHALLCSFGIENIYAIHAVRSMMQ